MMLISDFGFWISEKVRYALRVPGYALRGAGCGVKRFWIWDLHISDFGFRISDLKGIELPVSRIEYRGFSYLTPDT
jgi:hypothetical protein